jgi:glycerol kinase
MKILAIDQGTTATKSFTLDESGRFESVAAFEHKQIYPNAGWVEHDAEELLRKVQACLDAAGQVDAIGMDNHGETVVAWDAVNGRPMPCKRLYRSGIPRAHRLGTARMAMRGAGVITLSPLPAPRSRPMHR